MCLGKFSLFICERWSDSFVFVLLPSPPLPPFFPRDCYYFFFPFFELKKCPLLFLFSSIFFFFYLPFLSSSFFFRTRDATWIRIITEIKPFVYLFLFNFICFFFSPKAWHEKVKEKKCRPQLFTTGLTQDFSRLSRTSQSSIKQNKK